MLLMICSIVKHKTAYEVRISDWSSDVCSSDLTTVGVVDGEDAVAAEEAAEEAHEAAAEGAEEAEAVADAVAAEAAEREEADRSEARRVGKACVSTGRSRGSPCH